MKLKLTWIIAALAAASVGVNLFVFGFTQPNDLRPQVFNIAERIEADDWTKAGVPVVLHNHFASARVINGGDQGEVGLRYEGIVAAIFGVLPIDTSTPFIDLAGSSKVAELQKYSQWKGTNFCYGEETRRCVAEVIFKPEAEGTNVELVLVHLAAKHWAVVEKNLFEAIWQGGE